MGYNFKTHYYIEKREIHSTDKLSGQSLLVYGLDFIDKNQFKKMFNVKKVNLIQYLKKKVWINPSCCKVTFITKKLALNIF